MQKNTIGQHLLAACAFHSSMSKAHATCAKSCEDDSAMQTFHKAAAEHHLAMGEHYLSMGKCLRDAPEDVDVESDKAARTADLNKLVPTQAKGVMPSDVPGVRLIGRFGGPPVDAPPNVPAELADLVGE